MKTLIVLLSILFCNLHLAMAKMQALPDYITVTLRNVKSSKYMEVSGNPLCQLCTCGPIP
ncbi:hypothetical protein [Chitinophaga filiformis]|nr:hypothetical protein [Chitinophaga filiformis]